MSRRTALVMAGGTGGHIFPALAVAEALRERGWRVVWLGNAEAMESRLVPPRGFEFVSLGFGALRGKGMGRKLKLPFSLAVAIARALRLLGEVRPGVVLGMGGYVSFPGAVAARLRGIPLVVHEQNAVAGLANRVLARLADAVLTGFPGTLPGGRWVGNPVRREFTTVPPPEVRFAGRQGPLRLLVVGGSLGAKALNEVVPAALARLAPAERPVVTHQSGSAHFAALEQAYAHHGVEGRLLPFIEDMGAALAEADLVVSRAGAMTVAELAAVGVGAILVPFPHAVDDHQTANARFLVEGSAARLLPQSGLTPAGLAELLRGLDRERCRQMALAARALARPEATEALADELERLAKDGT
ncbi:undecaprenyldiphospho-muramoylpentapeptide beta-N-acetylglucosaminyltransferase [Tepidiphilus succinatimandens]|uniref:undecaprenyldiphospho-muramoylpentapeptide beta-N-acetylglucosaminyltransferase n=1 Tax=Tepidiphilus succinatimandens TaxID=224436 RepID=UPI00112F6FFB|nr:undecaprenyldiphospho-muramoylpentapeptide beta-N-acetylglucosaminyltransferase [Tepidiphilus succinatimandens]